MKFSYNWIKQLTGTKESPEHIAELLNLHTFEVETVEKVGNDFALDAKIPTNRISDAGNHVGIAREIAVIQNYKLQITKYKQAAQSKSQITKLSQPTVKISISKPDLCPRYSAAVLTIKKIGPSPRWMQDRLITCGFRPINVIVDITNYVMLETGQPLHAFDLDRIKQGRVLIRESKKGETLETLDGTPHTLPDGTIVIEDAERLIDLAGIMGGQNSAVSNNTQRILLQAATFDPVHIYKATRVLRFSSDAAKIYAAGSDPNKTVAALERASALFQETGTSGTPESFIDIYHKRIFPQNVAFRPEYADRIIGQALGVRFHQQVFERLGFHIKKGSKNWIVEVPTERRDLVIEEDLIEEVARLHGYEKIRAKFPESFLEPAPQNDEVWWQRRVADYCAGAGFSEHYPYEFCGDKELEQYNLHSYQHESALIELENPMNPETKYLCPRILVKFISAAVENLREFDTVKLFGVAKSFRESRIKDQESSVDEHKDLIITFAQKGTSGEEEFYQLKGVLDQLLEGLGIDDWSYGEPTTNSPQTTNSSLFHPHRHAGILVGEEKIGNLGEINPEILERLKSKARIVAAEVSFEKLWKLARAEQEYQPIGKYPAVVRDIAVVVSSDTRTDIILNIIENIAGKLLIDTDLFDYFQDEKMRESERKSLAFHLIFQSPERTLKDEDVNILVEKIIKALEGQNWQVRK